MMVIITTAVVVALAASAAWVASARMQHMAAESVLRSYVVQVMPVFNFRAWIGPREERLVGEISPPPFPHDSKLLRAVINAEKKILTSSGFNSNDLSWIATLPPASDTIYRLDLPEIGSAFVLVKDIDLRIPKKRPALVERPHSRDGDSRLGRIAERLDDRAEALVATLERIHPTLLLIHPLADSERELMNQGWLLAGMWVVACILVAGVALLVTSRVLRPVHQLALAIATIEPGKQNHHITVPALARELHPIQERLNDLMARVDKVLKREQQTTANIAHELRTPLAGLRTKLELALTRERDPADIAQLCRDGLNTMILLQGMVDNLLLLSRLEAGQERPRTEAVELAEIVAGAWSLHQPTALARRITIDKKIETALSLVTDGDKLRAIFSNIFSNAVAYATEHSTIQFSAHEQGDGRVRISIANDGATINAADAERVFETFWRGDTARTVEKGHCGLGLPLVRRLVTVLGGTVTAHVKHKQFLILILLPSDVRTTTSA
jgi:signal transduction histidine kinase